MKEVTRAIIVNKKGEVLVGKRARGKGVNLWAIIGGKVDPDEIPEDCVIREVQEELSVTFKPTLYKIEVETDDPETDWKVYYYKGSIKGDVNINEDENVEVRYISRDDVDTLSFAFGHQRVLKEFFSSEIN